MREKITNQFLGFLHRTKFAKTTQPSSKIFSCNALSSEMKFRYVRLFAYALHEADAAAAAANESYIYCELMNGISLKIVHFWRVKDATNSLIRVQIWVTS